MSWTGGGKSLLFKDHGKENWKEKKKKDRKGIVFLLYKLSKEFKNTHKLTTPQLFQKCTTQITSS